MQALAHAATPIVPVSTMRRWAGRGISALAGLFLVVDGAIKVLLLAPAVEATAQLGYPERLTRGLGLVELACLAVYALPRTAPLGALLLCDGAGRTSLAFHRAAPDQQGSIRGDLCPSRALCRPVAASERTGERGCGAWQPAELPGSG